MSAFNPALKKLHARKEEPASFLLEEADRTWKRAERQWIQLSHDLQYAEEQKDRAPLFPQEESLCDLDAARLELLAYLSRLETLRRALLQVNPKGVSYPTQELLKQWEKQLEYATTFLPEEVEEGMRRLHDCDGGEESERLS